MAEFVQHVGVLCLMRLAGTPVTFLSLSSTEEVLSDPTFHASSSVHCATSATVFLVQALATPLHAAAAAGHTPFVSALLRDARVQVNPFNQASCGSYVYRVQRGRVSPVLQVD